MTTNIVQFPIEKALKNNLPIFESLNKLQELFKGSEGSFVDELYEMRKKDKLD